LGHIIYQAFAPEIVRHSNRKDHVRKAREDYEQQSTPGDLSNAEQTIFDKNKDLMRDVIKEIFRKQSSPEHDVSGEVSNKLTELHIIELTWMYKYIIRTRSKDMVDVGIIFKAFPIFGVASNFKVEGDDGLHKYNIDFVGAAAAYRYDLAAADRKPYMILSTSLYLIAVLLITYIICLQSYTVAQMAGWI
jgi:hypothetical protein